MKVGKRYANKLLVFAVAITLGMLLPGILQASTIMPTETLTIITSSGQHHFEVEVARTDEEQARGLMERRYLPENRGMIFDYANAQPVSMWMHNTYISLDMLFIDNEGRVIRIAERTEPMSRKFIPSGGPVRAVVELNAGTASRIGAKVGDKIRIPFIERK